MKKYIANIITGSRIVFSLPLLFLPLSSAWFYAFYLFCGLSDMVDGTVSRRTNSATEFGARLDTVSDFVFMIVALIKFVPHLHNSLMLVTALNPYIGYENAANAQALVLHTVKWNITHISLQICL